RRRRGEVNREEESGAGEVAIDLEARGLHRAVRRTGGPLSATTASRASSRSATGTWKVARVFAGPAAAALVASGDRFLGAVGGRRVPVGLMCSLPRAGRLRRRGPGDCRRTGAPRAGRGGA